MVVNGIGEEFTLWIVATSLQRLVTQALKLSSLIQLATSVSLNLKKVGRKTVHLTRGLSSSTEYLDIALVEFVQVKTSNKFSNRNSLPNFLSRELLKFGTLRKLSKTIM